jgi:cation transport ATPase
LIKVENFEEQAGKGIQALVAEVVYKIGSRDFVLHTNFETDIKVLIVKLNLKNTVVYITIDEVYYGNIFHESV